MVGVKAKVRGILKQVLVIEGSINSDQAVKALQLIAQKYGAAFTTFKGTTISELLDDTCRELLSHCIEAALTELEAHAKILLSPNKNSDGVTEEDIRRKQIAFGKAEPILDALACWLVFADFDPTFLARINTLLENYPRLMAGPTPLTVCQNLLNYHPDPVLLFDYVMTDPMLLGFTPDISLLLLARIFQQGDAAYSDRLVKLRSLRAVLTMIQRFVTPTTPDNTADNDQAPIWLTNSSFLALVVAAAYFSTPDINISSDYAKALILLLVNTPAQDPVFSSEEGIALGLEDKRDQLIWYIAQNKPVIYKCLTHVSNMGFFCQAGVYQKLASVDGSVSMLTYVLQRKKLWFSSAATEDAEYSCSTDHWQHLQLFIAAITHPLQFISPPASPVKFGHTSPKSTSPLPPLTPINDENEGDRQQSNSPTSAQINGVTPVSSPVSGERVRSSADFSISKVIARLGALGRTPRTPEPEVRNEVELRVIDSGAGAHESDHSRSAHRRLSLSRE